ncbi:MAG: translation initiation factor IF-2, partial [Candidatus Hydrogenedentes bacterium]|nr:translation initiation factor IF-2 [Candidatus Hydrogenedentota bacterium]
MSPDDAVEKLRYMLFEIENANAVLTDEQADQLIEISDDPGKADEYREAKLKEVEKEKKRKENARKAAQKGAAKRKAAAAKKREAKEKASAKKKAATKAPAGEPDAPTAEILPPEVVEVVKEPGAVVDDTQVAEILPAAVSEEAQEQEKGETAAPKDKKKAKKQEKQASTEPAFKIGTAIDHEEVAVQVVRADGTHLAGPTAEIIDDKPVVEDESEETETSTALAEAERRQEEEEKKQARLAQRSHIKPDPEVVAEVRRRAAERMQKLGPKPRRIEPGGEGPPPAHAPQSRGSRGGSKGPRKKLRKQDKARADENLRRDAAAAIKEYQAGLGSGRKRKRRRGKDDEMDDTASAEMAPNIVIEIEENTSLEKLGEKMDVPVNELILALMDENILANKNQVLTFNTMQSLADQFGYELQAVIPEETAIMSEKPDDPADLLPRAPVVTVMGHVDHGKTTLLDRIRTANVAEGEVGGITQHIAAYDVPIRENRVTFLDTPGHEAFTAMRARGAQATDIVILVVAADDGVMPQTIEAIDHAKAAEVPIVVAVNKCDKPEANPERIRQELSRFDLMDEKWGGKTIIKDISAKMDQGIEELLELLVLEAEMLELKANPNRDARGVIVESEISRGHGPVAWVLVRNGTLRVGDTFLAGTTVGRVRTMTSSRGENLKEAGPSTPVLVTGFDYPPDAGDQFLALPDERVAKAIAEQRQQRQKQRQGHAVRRITLEDFHLQLEAGEKHELRVVLKADVQGSVDVLLATLGKAGNEEVSVSVVHSGVGSINESDVLLASASDAVVIGFHVTANTKVQKLAEQEGVEIRTYQIIYEAIDEVRRALEGLLTPDQREVITGHAEIRQIFRSSAIGNIAGSYVIDGEIQRNSLIRLVRDGVVMHEGRLNTLKREKEDVRAVQTGFECGIKIESYEDIKEGDVIEAYRNEAVAKTLS